jgi:GNAT superfamily N-acetyltransferase
MVVVERVGSHHWQRARAVRLRALRDAPDAFFSTVEQESALSEGAWRERLDRSDAVTLLALVDGADVGMAVGAVHHAQSADAGLYAMWVAPDVRGRGTGGALITEIIAWARATGHPRLRLDVGDHNARAVRLYERMGFVPTGATSRFPPPRSNVVEHERALDLRR